MNKQLGKPAKIVLQILLLIMILYLTNALNQQFFRENSVFLFASFGLIAVLFRFLLYPLAKNSSIALSITCLVATLQYATYALDNVTIDSAKDVMYLSNSSIPKLILYIPMMALIYYGVLAALSPILKKVFKQDLQKAASAPDLPALPTRPLIVAALALMAIVWLGFRTVPYFSLEVLQLTPYSNRYLDVLYSMRFVMIYMIIGLFAVVVRFLSAAYIKNSSVVFSLACFMAALLHLQQSLSNSPTINSVYYTWYHLAREAYTSPPIPRLLFLIPIIAIVYYTLIAILPPMLQKINRHSKAV